MKFKDFDKSQILEKGGLSPRHHISFYNNPELRAIINKESRKGKSYKEIAKACRDAGFPVKDNSIAMFHEGKLKLLSPTEVIELKETIVHDVNLLYNSINRVYNLLDGKITKWEREGKDKEFLIGVSQIREYHKMAMERLGELKGGITKVENQYNQTNIIMAKHQTDYLRELANEGKITITDETLRDLIYGRKVDNAVQPDKAEEAGVAEHEQGQTG